MGNAFLKHLVLDDKVEDEDSSSETPHSTMRIRLLFNRLSSRLSDTFCRTSNRYALVDEVANRKSNRRFQLKTTLLAELPFYLGLPLSLSLVYLNQALALCISFPLFLLFVLFLYHMLENALVYARNEPDNSRMLYEKPAAHGFNNWEMVTLRPDGENGPTVFGFLLLLDDPVARTNSPTVLMLHGNAGNAGHRLQFCRLLMDSAKCNILIIDYRGFGRSTGLPTEYGLYADARCALEFLYNRSDLATDKIYLFGRSLGGAVAIYLATNCPDLPIRGVMIENSFTSLPAVAQTIFGSSMSSITRFLLPTYFFINRYPSLDRLRISNCKKISLPPFLFLSGEADDIVPPRMMHELYQAYADNACDKSPPRIFNPSSFSREGQHGMVIFPEGRHNSTWLCCNWSDVISRFVQETLSKSVSVGQTAV